MKHIKYLEEEKKMLLNKEENNSTIVLLDGKAREVEDYNFLETRNQVREIDEMIANIKHAMNKFNSTTEVEEGLTIDKALVKLAQMNKELNIVKVMKGRAKETVEERYSNMFIRKVNYDINETEKYYQKLVREVYNLQMLIDKANLINTFEVE